MKFWGGHTYLRILISIGFLLGLTACGSSKTSSGSSDFASRSGGDISNSNKPISYCNKANTANLSYKLMSQYTGSTYDPNWAHLRIYNTPAGFDANATYLQFWKAYASSDALVAYHNTPIVFSIWDLQEGKYLKENLTSLKWSEVSNLISGASVSTFLARVMLVLNLQDPNGKYTVFSATAYSSADNSTQTTVNALLPAFFANPADYATKPDGFARETILRNMHPFRNQTSGDFASMALSLCQ